MTEYLKAMFPQWVFTVLSVVLLAVAMSTLDGLLLGVLFNRVPVALVWSGSAAALLIHFGLFFKGVELLPMSTFTFGNRGVTASLATLIVMPLLLVAAFLKR